MRNILSSAALLLVLSSGIAAQKGGGGGGHNGGGGSRGNNGNRGGGQQNHPQQPKQQPRPQQPQHQNPPQQPKQQPHPQQPRPTQAPWQGGKPQNGNRPGENRPGDRPRGGEGNAPWGNGAKPGDRNPDWNGGKGSDWGRGGDYGWNNVGGRDGGWRNGRRPEYTTIGYNPGWNWNQPNYYEPVYYTSYIASPTWDVPSYPIVTIAAPPIAQPNPGCVVVPTTQHTITETEATFTSTITEAPEGAVTVYVDQDGQQYTYGASTVFEVYIYTTTQSIDLVGDGLDCGGAGGGWQRKARRTVKPLMVPARVEARATPVM